MKNLVSTGWLVDHLYADDVVVLDASWHLPAAKRFAKSEFLTCRIPGARFFDIDDISDKATALPHMLPPPAVFEAKMSALGISNTSRVVAYDSVGLFSAARCWWMFRVFGHDRVAVLDGGLKKWLAEDRASEIGPPSPVLPDGLPERGRTSFKAAFRQQMVRSIDQLAGAQVADARSPTRFRGEEPEPRPGVKPGHMPGARNVHYASLLQPDGTMKSESELAAVFRAAGIDGSKPIVTSCGSGVTAAILTLGLEQIGAQSHALYDGSWAEWGASGREIVTGAEERLNERIMEAAELVMREERDVLKDLSN
jgi:thiosulfate/3-mercaptopyruvate sulfurtransferase